MERSALVAEQTPQDTIVVVRLNPKLVRQRAISAHSMSTELNKTGFFLELPILYTKAWFPEIRHCCGSRTSSLLISHKNCFLARYKNFDRTVSIKSVALVSRIARFERFQKISGEITNEKMFLERFLLSKRLDST